METIKNLEKGMRTEIQIDDITDMGQGIGRCEGMAVFVDGALPGDKVLAEFTKIKKNYAMAKTVEVLEFSSNRTGDNCIYRKKGCGGCLFDGYAYEGQLLLKEKQVKDKITRLAGIENPTIEKIIGMDDPYNYRNKAQMPVAEEDGTIKIGFFKGKSHSVINCKNCRLQREPVAAVAEALRQYMKECKVKAFNAEKGTGLIRHIVVKTAPGTGEVMVIIVASEKTLPNMERLAELLDDAVYAIPTCDISKMAEEDITEECFGKYSLESIVINVNKNKKPGGSVLGDDCITIAGKPTILEEVGGMKFEISPLAFYQVNPVQMEKLYGKVLEYCQLEGTETVFDLYCGVGTIGLFAAKQMVEKYMQSHDGQLDYNELGCVYGIESVKGAVIDANRNAVINGIVNARYVCGKAEEEIDKLAELAEKDPDVVIIDPPRAGCDARLLEAVAKSAPKRIVYVSCDPATMARDIKLLSEGFEGVETKYEFERATPVDMFPQTGEIECVTLLVQQKTK